MTKSLNFFDVLILIARPGAGKSEIIDFLKQVPIGLRKRRFRIGCLQEIDDFPMLWTWFEEDYLLNSMGFPRLYTDKDGFFLEKYLWDLLIERICLEYTKKNRDINYRARNTTIMEFSRGKEHGGFRQAFHHLSDEVLMRCAILYINVSWEQSLLKNHRRFNPNRPDSILEHGLPEEKLEKLYKESDWDELTSEFPDYLDIKGHQVPYAVMENEDDVTTKRGDALGTRLEAVLSNLWKLYSQRRTNQPDSNGL